MDAVREILADWTDVTVTRQGAIVSIAGFYQGRSYSGARADAHSLAHDLDRIARAEFVRIRATAVEAAPPVEPEWVEATPEPEPEPAPEPALEIDADAVSLVVRGPAYEAFNPDLWATLGEAQTALRGRVIREHNARTRSRALSLESALELAEIQFRTREQQIELDQHRKWAAEAKNADSVRDRKLGDIAALSSLEDARGYAATIDEGWAS